MPQAYCVKDRKMVDMKDAKQITLKKLRDCLRDMHPQVEVEPEIAAKARISIDRMLAIKP